MADDNVIQVEIEFSDGSKGFAKLKSNALAAGQDAGDAVSDAFSKSSKKLLGIAASIGAAVGAALFSRATIQAAAEQEAAFNRFSIALRSTGQFTKEFAQDFSDFASSLQETTKFQDDAVLSGAALLQQIGRLRQDQLIPATKAATDLAAALQIDLETAFTLVGKAAQGNVDSLKRYGIEVQKGSTDAETLANVLTKLNSSFGGAAAAEVKTFSGSVALLSNTFGELLETLGNVIIKNPAVIGLIRELGKSLADLTKGINVDGISNSLTDLIKDILSFAASANEFLTRPLLLFLDVGKFVFNSFRAILQTAVVSLTNYASMVATAFNFVGVVSDETLDKIKGFSEAAGKTFESFATDAKNSFLSIGESQGTADAINNRINQFKEALDLAIEASKKAGSEIPSNLGKIGRATEALSGSNQLFAADTLATYSGVTSAFSNFTEMLVSFSESFADNLSTVTQFSTSQVQSLANTVGQTAARGITNAITAVVKAMAAGQNAFEAFGKATLGLIGDLAISIGEFIVATGIGKLVLEALPGGAAIAAGLGLIAVGVVLKSIAGSGFTGASSGGGGGVAPASSIGGATSVPDQAGAIEEVGPKTEVIVNIQGNVLDRRESGLAIAEVLNEYFDTNDGAFARA